MNTIDSLFLLKEQLSKETFASIEEALLLELFDRPDLLNDISKALTGKTVGQHLQKGISKAANFVGNKVKDKVLKSNIVKNTVGKKEYEKAYKDLTDSETKYNQAKQNQKTSTDPSLKRVHGEDAKRYNKEANQRAKRVSEIKQKYGID